MGEHIGEFRSRLTRLERKYKGMSAGYDAKLRNDGLIVITPRRAKRRHFLMPVLIFLLGFMAFKGFLLMSLGPVSYEERVARLQEGTGVEQVGAFVMQSDPVSEMIAARMGTVLQ
ncbi:hypothetical protein GG681_10485 [Epibacterium sp. SM1969]|uniref:Uncharacterized protein n=1 Tax=Tritonibacter aquimaris TaxID=2663379 RepID=A0A844ATG1_9RHOB|nr:hypothetical protein [Tritonibacter aquimaris]MQY43067.1 hypothetical protein [Tritonibacter aquimaris]